MHKPEFYIAFIRETLLEHGVQTSFDGDTLVFSYNGSSVKYQLITNGEEISLSLPELPLHLLAREPQKITASILSKLHLNKVIYARKCEVKKISSDTARNFLDSYHLMKSTGSAFNFGIFYKEELLAVGAFSKGRKMNRLPADQRSFELIRLCTKAGVTVSGALTKIIRAFMTEKKAGDIMTYIDKGFFEGTAFLKAGFIIHSETPPQYFLIHRTSFESIPLQEPNAPFDHKKYYLFKNKGNSKLVLKNELLSGNK